ncbi:MAG TPA: hypothetical protein VI485_25525 [Vicinamibacterales bacterium]|nr:hypothetical protein [Vicinamibacterales bacterium]
MIAKGRYDVLLTAFGHLGAQDLERASGLVEEFGRGFDDEPSGVRLPRLQDARVDLSRCCRGLRSERILVVVPVLWRRGAEMNDSIVPAELAIKGGSQGGPELLRRAWPIGEAIDGATITQDNRRIVAIPRGLQLALDIEDRPLRGAATGRIVLSRKAAAKDYASSLGQDFHVGTE